MVQNSSRDAKTLIDELLHEQRSLTAVERFAQKHQEAEAPLQGRYYRDLIPFEKPHPGEQYAFEVDLDSCSGCKACVAACHSLNGLERDESWRSVGLLVSTNLAEGVQQTVTTACHHCVEPACLNGCPVLAYEKDEITGIVRHLDDQCIGCQYCILKCPYEVPRYSERLGIVRKCDMCSNRLSAGEAPACVQSCPNGAIRIGVVSQAAVRASLTRRESLRSDAFGGAGEESDCGLPNPFLPGSPDPSYTLPATRFLSGRGLPDGFRAVDEHELHPAPPHWPLVWMLVLTQAGIGSTWVGLALGYSGASQSAAMSWTSAGLILTGMFAGIFHLGRPLHAWRAFMGVRRSWLSREIIAFGVLALSVLLCLAAAEGLPANPASGLISPAALVFMSVAGAAALACSIMVYADTPRVFWNWTQTVPRFLGSTLLLGSAVAVVFHPERSTLYAVLTAAGLLKFAFEVSLFRALSNPELTPLKRSAMLIAGELSRAAGFRAVTLMLGSVLLAQLCFASGGVAEPWLPLAICAILFPGEIAERYLFFRAVAQPAMPGGLP